jgi:hypothetical protein
MNQGTKWLLLMKKNRSQKSRAGVPLRAYLEFKSTLKNFIKTTKFDSKL